MPYCRSHMNSSSYDTLSSVNGCAVPVVDAARVKDVLERMPPEDEVIDTADIFDLLSDPNRLRLLVAMIDGELCVCDLAALTGMSESATSHALRLLRAHRVVSARRNGRRAYYRLADSHVRMLLDLGFTHTQHTGERPGESPQPHLAGVRSAAHPERI